MNGEAGQGGINGQIYTSPSGSQLTVEPTKPGNRGVHLWTCVGGVEQGGLTLEPRALRDLAADLLARAALIERSGPVPF